jgi:hypothetical protein
MKDLEERCYNTKALKKLAEEAIARARSRRNPTPRKPVAVKDDRAAIISVAIANNCVQFGRDYITNFGADLASFRQALGEKLRRDKFRASLR